MATIRLLCLSFLALAAIALPGDAQAAYPERSITIIVPYTPGGPASILARIVGDRLSAVFKQPVIVDHKPSAGLALGAALVANAKPDGYTLFIGAQSMLIDNEGGRTPEQNIKELTPITLVGSLPLIVAINKDLPIKSIKDLIDYARAHPGQLKYGSSGTNSLTHLAGALLAETAGVQMLHVPYKGINEAMVDVVGGRVEASFAGAPISLPMAQSGEVRALAVTSAQRFSADPNIPTVAESGLAGYDVTPWYGMLATAGTPPDVIKRLHDEIVKILQDEDTKKKMLVLGADATYSNTPEEFGKIMQDEVGKWRKLVKAIDTKK